jgi:hypothetical protein
MGKPPCKNPTGCDCKPCRSYTANKKLKRSPGHKKHSRHGTRLAPYDTGYGARKVLDFATDVAMNYLRGKVISTPTQALSYSALAAIKSRL